MAVRIPPDRVESGNILLHEGKRWVIIHRVASLVPDTVCWWANEESNTQNAKHITVKANTVVNIVKRV